MKPFMLYLVGISGSGKTTIANALENEIKNRNHAYRLQVIDGDVIRDEFGGIFGFTKEERLKCNQAVRVVVGYLLKNDVSVILAQVAAYEEIRRKVRGKFFENYVEVYVKCSYEECAKRDVKGYYKKQKQGQMSNLNGANDSFEIPANADLIVDTQHCTVDEAVKEIISCLKEKGYAL